MFWFSSEQNENLDVETTVLMFCTCNFHLNFYVTTSQNTLAAAGYKHW